MKILLIDDKAKQGWKQLLEKVFPVIDIEITCAKIYKEAIEIIKDEFDLIFLDIRLDASDHNKNKIEEFSGYKILKEIRNNFSNINFATPIILLTASNKIWNIDAFRNYGVDAYYIKEHPDYVFDKETSKKKYDIFKKDFSSLYFEIGPKRKAVWRKSNEIINKITNHYYFNGKKRDENVRNRIIDKLKLGYVYLFKEQSLLEKELLKTNNESLAFIIFFSILEEIVKGFSDFSTWNNVTYERGLNWKYKNSEYFIEELRNAIKVNISKSNTKYYIKKEIQYEKDTIQFENYSNGVINLSEQLYSLLAAYSDDSNYKILSDKFREINKFRNEIDFIHSDVKTIFNKDLVRKDALEKAYQNSNKVLSFTNEILSLI